MHFNCNILRCSYGTMPNHTAVHKLYTWCSKYNFLQNDGFYKPHQRMHQFPQVIPDLLLKKN